MLSLYTYTFLASGEEVLIYPLKLFWGGLPYYILGLPLLQAPPRPPSPLEFVPLPPPNRPLSPRQDRKEFIAALVSSWPLLIVAYISSSLASVLS
jgi:hypothetical protein